MPKLVCPKCQNRFSVASSILAAQPSVRCPECNQKLKLPKRKQSSATETPRKSPEQSVKSRRKTDAHPAALKKQPERPRSSADSDSQEWDPAPSEVELKDPSVLSSNPWDGIDDLLGDEIAASSTPEGWLDDGVDGAVDEGFDEAYDDEQGDGFGASDDYSDDLATDYETAPASLPPKRRRKKKKQKSSSPAPVSLSDIYEPQSLEQRLAARAAEHGDSDERDAALKGLILPAAILLFGGIWYASVRPGEEGDIGGRMKPFIEAFGREGILVLAGFTACCSCFGPLMHLLEFKYGTRTRLVDWFQSGGTGRKAGVIAAGVTAFVVVVGSFTAFALMRIEARKNAPGEDVVLEDDANDPRLDNASDTGILRPEGRPYNVGDFQARGNYLTFASVKETPIETTPSLLQPVVPVKITAQDEAVLQQGPLRISGEWGITIRPPDLPEQLAAGRVFAGQTSAAVRGPDSRSRDASLKARLADAGGPFLLTPPEKLDDSIIWEPAASAKDGDVNATPVAAKKKLTGDESIESVCHLTEPFPVVDLRTGEEAGYFPPTLPLWQHVSLSPRGEWALSGDPVPEEFENPERALFVWQRDELDGPVRTIPYSGIVMWISFIDDERFVWTEFNETESFLHVQSVTSDKPSHSVELPLPSFVGRPWVIDRTATDALRKEYLAKHPPEPPRRQTYRPGKKLEFEEGPKGPAPVLDLRSLKGKYDVRANLGLVCPNGQFVLLQHKHGCVLFSMQDGRILGRIAPEKTDGGMDAPFWSAAVGVGTDRQTLMMTYPRSGKCLEVSLQTGRYEGNFPMRLGGYATTLSDGPTPDTVSFTDRHLRTLLFHKRDESVTTLAGRIDRQAQDGTCLVFYKSGVGQHRDHSNIYVTESPQQPESVRPGSAPPTTAARLAKLRESAALNESEDSDVLQPKSFNVAERTDEATRISRDDPEWTVELTPGLKDDWEPSSIRLPDDEWPDGWDAAASHVLDAGQEPLQWTRTPLKHSEKAPQTVNVPIAADWWRSRKSQESPLPSSRDRRRSTGGPSVPFVPDDLPKLASDKLRSKIATSCNCGATDRLFVLNSDGSVDSQFTPYARRLEWYDWVDDGLVTVGDGCVTFWDAEAGKVIHELDGGYTGRFAADPEGKWIAVSAPGRIDVHQVSDWKPLVGRFRTDEKQPLKGLCVSADGRRLAGWARVVDVGPNPGVRPDASANIGTFAWIGNMETGEIVKLKIADGSAIRYISFLKPHLLLVRDSRQTSVFDIDRGQLVVQDRQSVRIGPNRSLWRVVRSRYASRDGRNSFQCSQVNFPDLSNAEHRFVFGSDEPTNSADDLAASDPAGSDVPVFRLEADLIDPRFARKHGPTILARMQEMGVRIGDDGWVVRLRANAGWSRTDLISSSDMGLMFSGKRVNKLRIPSMKYRWEIINPAGETVFTEIAPDGFRFERSRYYRHPNAVMKRTPGESAGVYDFPDDPTKLIAEEILSEGKGLKRIPIPEEYRSGERSADGQKIRLPIELESR